LDSFRASHVSSEVRTKGDFETFGLESERRYFDPIEMRVKSPLSLGIDSERFEPQPIYDSIGESDSVALIDTLDSLRNGFEGTVGRVRKEILTSRLQNPNGIFSRFEALGRNEHRELLSPHDENLSREFG
jgi:hypothetical protein